MDRQHLAAQMFTVREHTKTPSDIAASLRKIKDIGYDAVQVSGTGPVETSELKKMLDDAGLKCCATHEGAADILDQTGKVVDRLLELECAYTAYPFPHTRPRTAEDYLKLADKLETAARLMREKDVVLAYHNHALEFERFGPATALDLIYDRAPALQGEIDTYWVQKGGGDPVAWCRKLKGRLPLLHLKDYGIVDGEPAMTEVGRGNLDWERIIAAARDAGTVWYLVEQDICGGDPFDSLKISLENLLAMP